MSISGTEARRAKGGLGRVQDFLKQIVYGGNDGIVTTFAIVAGFAGAQAEGVEQIGGLAVLVFGLANLFADGVSMGLGEFLSERAKDDLYHSRRSSELHQIATAPAQERTELIGLLQQRGLSEQDAAGMADIAIRNPEMMADLMMGYEYGMNDPSDTNTAINGLFTFGSFLAFGFIPLVPYFLFDATATTFYLSVAATFSALAALGFLRWFATREGMARAVGETVILGALCAAVAFGVGWLVGG